MEKKEPIKYGQPGSMEYILKSVVARSKGGIVKLSPGTASRILDELNKFPRQRVIDHSRVYGHAHRIVKGDWLESFSIDFVELKNGRIWLVDGQNRLTAIKEQDSPVDVTLRIIPVESEFEAKQIFAGYDQKSSVRTNRQIIDAMGIAEEAGLSRKMTNVVFDAATLLLNDLEPITGSANTKKYPELFFQDNKLAMVKEWASEAMAYEAIIKKSKKGFIEFMRGTGVVAVALYTLRHQPAKAKEFWTGVAENDGLRKNDPRSALISDLLIRQKNAGNIRQKVQQPSLAWNAWCENRPLSIIKCITGAQLSLWGTPLNGKGKK